MEDVLTGLLAWMLSGVAAIAIAWLRGLGARTTVAAALPQTIRRDFAPMVAEPALVVGTRMTGRVERWLVRMARRAPEPGDPARGRVARGLATAIERSITSSVCRRTCRVDA
jgi:hypothetical protein